MEEEKVGHPYKDAITPVRTSRIRGERSEKHITYEIPKKQEYTLNQLGPFIGKLPEVS